MQTTRSRIDRTVIWNIKYLKFNLCLSYQMLIRNVTTAMTHRVLGSEPLSWLLLLPSQGDHQSSFCKIYKRQQNRTYKWTEQQQQSNIKRYERYTIWQVFWCTSKLGMLTSWTTSLGQLKLRTIWGTGWTQKKSKIEYEDYIDNIN